MIPIDTETIGLFHCFSIRENALSFYGDKLGSWEVIYKKDLSSVRAGDFYKIINPLATSIIENIYLFNHLTDALIFFYSRKITFFKNALICISDANSNVFIKQYILGIAGNKRKKIKLHFYHRANSLDLFTLYLDLLSRDISYSPGNDPKNATLHIGYKSSVLVVEFKELWSLRFLLGIKDNDFRIKNELLKPQKTNIRLIW